MFSISEVDKSDSDLALLVSELDAFQSELYPAESNHCLDLSTVGDEQLGCVIVRDERGDSCRLWCFAISGIWQS
ncbi:hypothetical protein [Pantoea vagans]|uniref:hypothetical protein n=1 Tax=Pantoea vagans TaxID=470934 RepID=UPI0028AFCA71|nr:hypothetical protein [Pantoea vagans]